MDKHDLERLMEEALYEGRITVECPKCFTELVTEPDADDAWCESCQEVVTGINPLIKAGLM